MYCLNIKKIIIIILYCSVIITGCSDTLNLDNKYSYYRSSKNYKFAVIEEYVSRVGKRLLIVNDNQILNNLNIKFAINNSEMQSLNIQYEQNYKYKQKHVIIVSKGLLNYLQDEAELATILAIALETINSNDIISLNSTTSLKADSRIINNLYKAGYDPLAFVALQEEYLKDKNHTYSWLNFLFSPMNISEPRIYANQKKLLSIPKGLQRGKQNYLSNICLLKPSEHH